ncbi:TIGR01777 family oxidoreductase [Lentibacillus sediminis]|uniref:TIGR01777 family oxidoreductase n=1 Tax=Lentibacillus sediminis TaxID=1940529 RepID=UPI000C1BB823|nr:TIGR01777 family oxidoreductase [Lentibacillus sediminis]
MNILITGGTGFVGKHLTKSLTEKDHHVYILTRSKASHTDTERVSYIGYDDPIGQLPAMQACINLAGESLFGYWTKRKKEAILTSRIETTRQIIEIMKQLRSKPEVFISGSAVGFYGISEDMIFTESTSDPGSGFLAEVSAKWEETASVAENLGIRTVYTRFGVILGEEGAYPLMRLPVKLFVGGKIGNGEQWLSWVHIDDVVNLIQFCLFTREISGPVNVTAPHPKRNKDFTKMVAKAEKRPYWLPVPSSMLELMLGEMSQLVVKGQYVLPKKAQSHGYQFAYPRAEQALKNLH